MDSGISAWAAKYQYDSVRPITSIRARYKDKPVNSWLGPGKGYGTVLGQNWLPFQEPTIVTPPFPEYVSGHSTFSAAEAYILRQVMGSDLFGDSYIAEPGSSQIEPGITPKLAVVLLWPTLSSAADQAGLSRRYG